MALFRGGFMVYMKRDSKIRSSIGFECFFRILNESMSTSGPHPAEWSLMADWGGLVRGWLVL